MVFLDKSIARHPVPLCHSNFEEGQHVATRLAPGVAIYTRCAWCFGALPISFQTYGSGAETAAGVLTGGLALTLRTSLSRSCVMVVGVRGGGLFFDSMRSLAAKTEPFSTIECAGGFSLFW